MRAGNFSTLDFTFHEVRVASLILPTYFELSSPHHEKKITFVLFFFFFFFFFYENLKCFLMFAVCSRCFFFFCLNKTTKHLVLQDF